jgi:hypothetical protein
MLAIYFNVLIVVTVSYDDKIENVCKKVSWVSYYHTPVKNLNRSSMLIQYVGFIFLPTPD